jgi:hypothetical protein
MFTQEFLRALGGPLMRHAAAAFFVLGVFARHVGD